MSWISLALGATEQIFKAYNIKKENELYKEFISLKETIDEERNKPFYERDNIRIDDCRMQLGRIIDGQAFIAKPKS